MLIATSDLEAEGTLLVLGLSHENIKRLQDGKPIRVTRESHGLAVPAGLKLVIFTGETEASMEADLRKFGLIGDTTVLNQQKAQ